MSLREEMHTVTGLNPADLTDELRAANAATYCPEDNKIRLYLPERVERDSYLYLRKIGYTATPKQDCAFVATWGIKAENAAFALIADDDQIGDEDYSPEERAADRAERFAGYRDKRRGEAHEHADNYDAGPSAHGYQSQARAERAAARHERQRSHALNQWEKAEYWQQRTAGVIAHALHRSSPSVRRGRILEIEKEIRRVESSYTPRDEQRIIQQDRQGVECEHAWCGQGRGGRWVPVRFLEEFRQSYARYLNHLHMRLIYENAMLENEGGKAADVDMVPGGWVQVGAARRGREYLHVDGWAQIIRVNKSNATKRVTSVVVLGRDRFGYCDPEKQEKVRELKINIERSGEGCYRAPTPEELQQFQAEQRKRKAASKKSPRAETAEPDQ